MAAQRKAGILLHVSALPGKYGIGTLGKHAFEFIDWLKAAGMRIWQMLPLLPTGYGDSPYQAIANNALNYYFIDFDLLQEDGLLLADEYENIEWCRDERRVDYEKQFLYKTEILKKAFNRFDKTAEDWKAFCENGRYLDFAVFMTIKSKQGYRAFTEWEDKYRIYSDELFKATVEENRCDVEFWQFTQYLFLKQWKAVKEYANSNGITIMGDMPIYVSADSVEMWKYKHELFLLDEDGNCSLVAGVPPDAFSDDGQLWGNPIYNWDYMKANGYKWWKDRIDYAFELFDTVRIDHFRGFDRFYAIESGEKTAKHGKWMDGPSAELFKDIKGYDIVAEDLGVIDDGVIQMMKKVGYPGMKVVEFAFDGNPQNEHKPTNFTENYVAYTGTHDNQPLLGYIKSLNEEWRSRFDKDLSAQCRALGVRCNRNTAEAECKTVIRLITASEAKTCIFPMQDILVLGDYARMNFPSTVSVENWSFRFKKEDFNRRTAGWLNNLTKKYGRQ